MLKNRIDTAVTATAGNAATTAGVDTAGNAAATAGVDTAGNAATTAVAAAAAPPPGLPPANWERMRNYYRVASGNITDALEEFIHQVNYMPRTRYAWHKALEKVDDPAESPGGRAACFHHLVGQSTGDALAGDPVAWQPEFDRNGIALPDWAYLTPPEQIAHIVQRIRREFPEVVAAEKAALPGLIDEHIASLGLTEEDIAEAIREARQEEQCYPYA